MIRASAPGKLMLAGEYTVTMAGGPAMAVAVDRRVSVTLELGGTRWRVSSPALGLTEADPVEVPVIAELLKQISGLPAGGHLVIESELGVGADKPGLGASAAVCTAVHGALVAGMTGDPPSDMTAALDAHYLAQGGRGSGYDIATCHVGGVCLYDPQKEASPVEGLGWPDGLHAAVFFTGCGASTIELLGAIEAFREEQPAVFTEHLERMSQAAEFFVAAWHEGHVEDILDAAADAQERLTLLSRAGELDIDGGGQAELLAAIEEAGAIGRTSGAGGGDCAWALTDRPETLEAAAQAAEALGYSRLMLSFGQEDGLTVEHVADSAPEG